MYKINRSNYLCTYCESATTIQIQHNITIAILNRAFLWSYRVKFKQAKTENIEKSNKINGMRNKRITNVNSEWINNRIHTYIHTYTYTHAHNHRHAHIYIYIHMHTHTQTHKHTHTHTHTHTQIYIYISREWTDEMRCFFACWLCKVRKAKC